MVIPIFLHCKLSKRRVMGNWVGVFDGKITIYSDLGQMGNTICLSLVFRYILTLSSIQFVDRQVCFLLLVLISWILQP
ncbi:hypothetical protein RchiOBHm_Chr3g0491681 [Rosa chinensis]|uniref:Uncharacterized protein n=1 Tax=Rosa chinensis TaxID=74649 RepID=A0A2P6RGB6_ROSCH|nr:hypothetical protein RchiOBHm_Chr3g0491681 [Rosa chinensis]